MKDGLTEAQRQAEFAAATQREQERLRLEAPVSRAEFEALLARLSRLERKVCDLNRRTAAGH